MQYVPMKITKAANDSTSTSNGYVLDPPLGDLLAYHWDEKIIQRVEISSETKQNIQYRLKHILLQQAITKVIYVDE